MIPPSWLLIVQLGAQSLTALQYCWGASWDRVKVSRRIRLQFGSSESLTVWYQYHYKKSCFQVFLICFLRVGRRFITHTWNLSCGQPGFWIARGIRQKALLKSRNSARMGRAFDLENLLKERKETVLSVNAESRPEGAICFLKRGNVILSYIRIQLTVILILPTFINRDQVFTVSIKCKK